jgi:hypothetical protein
MLNRGIRIIMRGLVGIEFWALEGVSWFYLEEG